MGVDPTRAPLGSARRRRCGAVASPAPGSAILIPRERSTTPSATRMRAAVKRRERLGPRTALFFSRVAPLQAATRPGPRRTPRERGG